MIYAMMPLAPTSILSTTATGQEWWFMRSKLFLQTGDQFAIEIISTSTMMDLATSILKFLRCNLPATTPSQLTTSSADKELQDYQTSPSDLGIWSEGSVASGAKALFPNLISLHRNFSAKFREFVNFWDFREKFPNYFCILKANK